MAHTKNTIFIEAPYDLVFDVSNDIERWTELFNEYTEAKVLSREGDKITFQLTNMEGKSWRSVRVLDKEGRKATASREEPMFPFKYMNLFWTYVERDGGVELTWEQDFEMDDKAPVDNDTAIVRINEHSRANMQGFKEKIEAMGR
jgi:aromatase